MFEKRLLVSHKKRESTDLICLIIFVTITLILLISGLYCFFSGSIGKLQIPYDSDGKGCGLDYPQYPFIYFPSPQYDSLWVTTCVKKCPSTSNEQIQCKTNSVVTACVQNNSVDNKKAFHVYSTQIFRGSVCLPAESVIRQKVFAGIKAHPVQEMFRSVIRDWSLLLLMVPIVIAMILVAMVLIRLTAGYVIYVLYAVAISCFIGFGIFLAVPPTSDQAFIIRKNRVVSILCSVFSFIIASIILYVFCSYRAKIKAAVRYIDQSNLFFKDNYYLLVLPFILIGALVLFIFFWTFLTVSFYSMSAPVRQTNQLPFQHYILTPPLVALMNGSLFYLLWGVFFLIHTGSFIISGTVVNWQYGRSSPYLASSKSYLSSHMGSVCLGSFLTTLLGLFKIELDEADCAQRDPERQKKQKKCIDWLKSCYGCFCCCCVNYIFRCFHHASYVYQNMIGLAYCHSSSEIYQAIRQQKEQWSIIAFLYLIFDQFIPLTLTVVGTLISNVLIDGIYTYQSGTPNRVLVLLVVAIISYSISQFFIGIYSETIQSLFVIDLVHNNLLANPQELRIRLSEGKQKPERQHSQRYSLFPKPA